MNKKQYIILFDGECNFCSFWVKYVIKRDKKDVFRFASLQSETGRNYLRYFNVDRAVDSVILIEDDQYFIKSTASLKILKTLGGFRSVFYGLIVFPGFIRNIFYDLIAISRYRLFGRKVCELPQNSNFAHKFL